MNLQEKNLNIDSVISDVKSHLSYLMEEGVDSIPEFGVSMKNLKERLMDCQRCDLHLRRNNIVFGEGNLNPDLVLVAEAPGFDEDRLGRPFVGKAGMLLDRIIKAMGLNRKDLYICNVVKCRPPDNRDPHPQEIATCGEFLKEQIRILNPKIILALGRISGRFFTNQKDSTISSMRGTFHDYNGVDLRVTYHPAALLRNSAYKRPLWEDVQEVMKRLGRPIKKR